MPKAEDDFLLSLNQLGVRMRRGDADAFSEFVSLLSALVRNRGGNADAVERALAFWVTSTAIAAARPDQGSVPTIIGQFSRDLDEMLAAFRHLTDLQGRITNLSVPSASGIKLGIEQRPRLLMTGDFVDCSNRQEWTWLVLGDASQHGPAAAYYANTVFPVLRIYLSLQPSLSDAVKEANRCIYSNKPKNGDECAAVQIAAWNPHRRELQLVNAGIPVRPIGIFGGVAQCLDVGGLALGWLPLANYQAATYVLSPGDRIVLTTDGIKEQTNATGEQYGEERLCRTVQLNSACDPQALARIIMNSVDAYSSGLIDDDQTALVAEFT